MCWSMGLKLSSNGLFDRVVVISKRDDEARSRGGTGGLVVRSALSYQSCVECDCERTAWSAVQGATGVDKLELTFETRNLSRTGDGGGSVFFLAVGHYVIAPIAPLERCHPCLRILYH